MPRHDTLVLAGEKGSPARTKRVNQMLDAIDKRIAEVRRKLEGDIEEKKIQVKSRHLAEELAINKTTVTRNGFPEFFTRVFDCCELDHHTLVIQMDEWIEERKDQRKRLSEYRES